MNTISTKAILFGVVLTLSLACSLNLLGMGIGLASIDFETKNSIAVIGWSSYLWLFLSTFVSILIGSFVASYVVREPMQEVTNYLQGICIWALVTLITFAMATTSIGFAISGTNSLINNVISVIDVAKPNLDISPVISGQAKTSLQNMVKRDISRYPLNEKNIGEVATYLNEYLLSDDPSIKAGAKQRIMQILEDNVNMDPEQVDEIVDQWQDKYQKAKENITSKVQDTANQASNGLAKNFLSLFFINLFSMIAAFIGSKIGMSLQRKE